MHLPLFVQTCAQRSASFVPAPPPQQVENAADDIDRVFRVETGRLDHRARPDAFAAARAVVENVVDPAPQRVEKRNPAGIRDRHRRLP